MSRPALPAVVMAALLACGASQAPPTAPAPSGATPILAADAPLQCWWRSSAGAIRLGEIAEVTLTCAVLESDAVRVVPDESRLAVASIQLAPFEIVGGTHPSDTRAGARRFFQYTYLVRLIDADVIGRDVKLPPLSIPYRVQSQMGGGATLAGRDLTHLMPQIAIRVVSQVPADATDIRDGSAVSLAHIDDLRFRSSAYRVAGIVLGALGFVVALTTLAPLVRRTRPDGAALTARVSDRAVLGCAARALEELERRGAASGWPGEAIAEAHRAVRLIAAVALGIGVRQQALEPAGAVPEGRLLVTHGLRRRRTALTASLTASALAQALDRLPATAPAGVRTDLTRLVASLTCLTRAQYAVEPADDASVADAVQSARSVAAQMARGRLWTVGGWRTRPPAQVVPVPRS